MKKQQGTLSSENICRTRSNFFLARFGARERAGTRDPRRWCARCVHATKTQRYHPSSCLWNSSCCLYAYVCIRVIECVRARLSTFHITFGTWYSRNSCFLVSYAHGPKHRSIGRRRSCRFALLSPVLDIESLLNKVDKSARRLFVLYVRCNRDSCEMERNSLEMTVILYLFCYSSGSILVMSLLAIVFFPFFFFFFFFTVLYSFRGSGYEVDSLIVERSVFRKAATSFRRII